MDRPFFKNISTYELQKAARNDYSAALATAIEEFWDLYYADKAIENGG